MKFDFGDSDWFIDGQGFDCDVPCYSFSFKLSRFWFLGDCKYRPLFLRWVSMEQRAFVGWGLRGLSRRTFEHCQKLNGTFYCLEDGFIRSVGLGALDSPSFSIVGDDVGIYYNAKVLSRLTNILQKSDFQDDGFLMHSAQESIKFLQKYHISKYNASPDLDLSTFSFTSRLRVLIIAQTAGDMSLAYGYGDQFTTDELIRAAISENPGADVYVKVHPDVLAGKKKSDLDLDKANELCTVISDDVNPISLLKHFHKVYTKTSQMGFEALLLGKEVVCFGMPFYAGWGLTDDRVSCPRRTRKRTVEEVFAAAYILYTHYFNPYTGKKSDIFDTLYTIRKYRDISRANAGDVYLFGFSGWKRGFVRPFFHSYQKHSLRFCKHLKRAKKKGLEKGGQIVIWGQKKFPEVEAYAFTHGVPVSRVEDGFIRSVALGSDLTRPYSLIVDSRGIYFDPNQESDLEHLLSTYDFHDHPGLLDRAEITADQICKARLSKYNGLRHKEMTVDRSLCDKVILIPGQVEDDASIRFGGYGMTNGSLIEAVRKSNPDSFLIYKPHPDVLAGNRKGALDEVFVLSHCDLSVSEQSIDSCLEVADEVHTITSLSGFDALLRGKHVVTYGMPFYAGWGLTEDIQVCERRTRRLKLSELVAGTLLLYPRYVHPKTGQFCEVELILEEIKNEQKRYFSSRWYRSTSRARASILRLIRRAWEFCLGGC